MGVASVRAAVVALALAATSWACAGSPPPEPSDGRATAWGTLRLVPREGVVAKSPGASSPYAGPGLRGVTLVDYQHPGFAIVYLEGTPSPAGTASLAIRDGQLRPYLDPERAAVGVGGVLRVANASRAAHAVSLPELSRVQRLEPGEELAVELAAAGEVSVFLLDAPEASGRLFVAPGRFVVPSQAGRWELRDLPPGRLRLHAWHPRFPPLARELDLPAGAVLRVDLEMGVGSLADPGDGG